MARQIGKMLNAREPKVVNGPEILNKFVGQSEENIRKLFGDAEKEVSIAVPPPARPPVCCAELTPAPSRLQYKEKGDESGLHIIIFDELDAICKQRGSTNNGTGVGDSVVNQLLSKVRPRSPSPPFPAAALHADERGSAMTDGRRGPTQQHSHHWHDEPIGHD